MKKPKITVQQKNNAAGFTIIELLIATTVFSLVLLLCTVGLLQVSRVYYKGLTGTKVQEALRAITDQATRAIQFNGSTVVPTPSSTSAGSGYVFCVGDQRYSIVTGRQLTDGTPGDNQSKQVLIVDTPAAGCDASSTAFSSLAADARELLSPNMRLTKFQVQEKGDNLYAINARVVYGDDDLLCSPMANDCNSTTPSTALSNEDLTCKNVKAGSQFCAVGELNTVVQKRL